MSLRQNLPHHQIPLWQNQTQAHQISTLGLLKDEQNCLSWFNGTKCLLTDDQISVKLLSLPQTLDTPSTWAGLRSLMILSEKQLTAWKTFLTAWKTFLIYYHLLPHIWFFLPLFTGPCKTNSFLHDFFFFKVTSTASVAERGGGSNSQPQDQELHALLTEPARRPCLIFWHLCGS